MQDGQQPAELLQAVQRGAEMSADEYYEAMRGRLESLAEAALEMTDEQLQKLEDDASDPDYCISPRKRRRMQAFVNEVRARR